MVQAGDVVRPQGNLEARQSGDGFGQGLQGNLLFFVQRLGRVVIPRSQEAVDDELLVGNAQGGQLLRRPRRFFQGQVIGTGDEEHRRLLPVGQGLDGLFIQFFPRFQPRQLPQAGRAVFALLDELAPRRRQLQHAQGVACRRRIENDVVVIAGDGFVGEEVGELIEGGDFYSTRAGQLFFHVAQGCFRQEAAIRADDAFPIFGSGLDRVEVGHGQIRHGVNGCSLVSQFHGKDVLQVRRRIGTDEQYLLPGIGQGDGRSTGDGCLADAALASQEEVFRLDDAKGIIEDHLQSPPQQHDELSGSAGASPQQQEEASLSAGASLLGKAVSSALSPQQQLSPAAWAASRMAGSKPMRLANSSFVG